jgi:hypothetical protein
MAPGHPFLENIPPLGTPKDVFPIGVHVPGVPKVTVRNLRYINDLRKKFGSVQTLGG